MNKKTSKQTGQAMTPLQRAEARLQAVAAELQQEKHRRDELSKKRERFVRAVAEAKAQRESCAYQAYGHDDAEAMKILADAQRRTREAEDELLDLNTAAAACEQRVADLEGKQQECQRTVNAATAAGHGENVVEIAGELDPVTQQLTGLLVRLKNEIEAARGYGHNALEQDEELPPFWQLSARVYLRYLLALLIQQGFPLVEPTSSEWPDHAERKDFVEAGSFQNYIAGLVGKGMRRLKLEAPDGPEGEAAA